MTPQMRRIVLGFLAVFILLSLAPMAGELPGLVRAVTPGVRRALAALPSRLTLPDGFTLSDRFTLPAGVLPALPGPDALLATAAGLTLLLLVLLLHRHLTAAPVPARATRPTRRAVARREPEGGSELSRRLRDAARGGERVQDLARQFHLSQDAVRVALGRGAPTPAARGGKGFRPRQPSLPAGPRARPVAARPSGYRALA